VVVDEYKHDGKLCGNVAIKKKEGAVNYKE
jgi:hypothetical protein